MEIKGSISYGLEGKCYMKITWEQPASRKKSPAYTKKGDQIFYINIVVAFSL
jgi:hypothetical protein